MMTIVQKLLSDDTTARMAFRGMLRAIGEVERLEPNRLFRKLPECGSLRDTRIKKRLLPFFCLFGCDVNFKRNPCAVFLKTLFRYEQHISCVTNEILAQILPQFFLPFRDLSPPEGPGRRTCLRSLNRYWGSDVQNT